MRDEQGWKIIKTTVIPKCDMCKKPDAGVFDVPLVAGGSWGNLCNDCINQLGNIENAKAVGSKRILIKKREEAYDSNEVVTGKELTSLEDLVNEEDREVECPRCGEIKTIEPDASGTFACEGCGVRVQIESLI